MNAYRKHSCLCQSSVHTHFKTVVHSSRSALACLSSGTWWMYITFLICVSRPVVWAFSVLCWSVSPLNCTAAGWSCCYWRSVYEGFRSPRYFVSCPENNNFTWLSKFLLLQNKPFNSEVIFSKVIIVAVKSWWVDTIFTVRRHTSMFLVCLAGWRRPYC